MLVLGMDSSSQLRLHSQQIEIVAGDCMAVDTLHDVTPTQSRLTKSVETRDIAEGGVSLPNVFERRIGRSELLKARPRLEAKLVEVLRVAHFQRVQQDCIYYSENNDVCANSQHQSD